MSNAMSHSDLKMVRPKHRLDVQSRLVDGEMVVLDREQGLIHQLNRTATFIWEKCDGHRSAAEIAVQLSESFAVDETTALDDVIQILITLQQLKLVDTI
jgi:hypothetical protein